jgi:hypothetical protein
MQEKSRDVAMNCEQCRTAMMDAATDGLARSQRAKFEAHVQGCAVCGEELQRVKMLLREIDRGVAAEVAAEPSADLLRNVRQRIAEESAAKNATPLRWVAVAVCAAVVMVAAVTWMMRAQRGTFRTARENVQTAAGKTPRSSAHAAAAIRNGETPKTPSEGTRVTVASARRIAAGKTQLKEREPEVIVPPGEMQLVMKLAAMLKTAQGESSSITTAKLNQVQTAEPLEIKPLAIAPLNAAKEGGAAAGSAGDTTNPQFVDTGKLR